MNNLRVNTAAFIPINYALQKQNRRQTPGNCGRPIYIQGEKSTEVAY